MQSERLSKTGLSLKKTVRYQKYGSKNSKLPNMVPSTLSLSLSPGPLSLLTLSIKGITFLLSSLWFVVDLHSLSLLCRKCPDPLTQIFYVDTLTASPDWPYISELILTLNSLFLLSVAIFQSNFFDAAAFSMLKHLSIAKKEKIWSDWMKLENSKKTPQILKLL